ncbi:MAG TPA: N-acetylmuramoyl-L-alanine amidase [Candidatus Dormibacteraeota bacterium]|nr:N-acetylmuramoyl-L-alanine amidase [Candidatus Dormibacteraeota bacterium]
MPDGVRQQACLRFVPSHPTHTSIVFIDPGHGGLDPGGQGQATDGTSIPEKDVSLATARLLAALLLADGYPVVMSRDMDITVANLTDSDLQGGILTADAAREEVLARASCANTAKADVLVSIHFDAFEDPGIGGAETLYDDARPFADRNQALATLVQKAMVTQLTQAGWPVPDRGVTADSQSGTPALTAEGDGYGHLLLLGPASDGWVEHPSTMPACLVEPLFLTRPTEADVAESPRGRQVMARALSQALETYLAG